MASAIVHPRLHQALAAFYPSTCTIQQAALTQDASGHPVPAWSDLAGHAALSARLSPIGGTERKTASQIYSVATHVINLAGSYPAITAKMRAVIAGQSYDILLVEQDGQTASTRLVAEVVR